MKTILKQHPEKLDQTSNFMKRPRYSDGRSKLAQQVFIVKFTKEQATPLLGPLERRGRKKRTSTAAYYRKLGEILDAPITLTHEERDYRACVHR